jgi:hypothetical protein
VPVDPSQIAQDKDFLSASPDDQIKYLSSVDSDFAKAEHGDQLAYISHITGKPVSAVPKVPAPAPTPSMPLAPDAWGRVKQAYEGNLPLLDNDMATLSGVGKIAHGTVDAVRGGWNLLKTAADAWNNPKADVGDAVLPDPHAEQVPGAIHDINASPDPTGTYLNVAGDTAAQGAGQAIAGAATEGAMRAVPKILRAGLEDRGPTTNIVEKTYSKPGDHVAAALRSDTHIDVPAEAKIAHSAIEEGLSDRGVTTKDFKGRNGPTALQAGIDNAIDINEARAKQVIDPIRGEAVDPKVLADNPELAQRFEGKSKVTYGDLDAERIKMNKELRSAGFYSKPPSAQYAAQDPLASTEAAVRQARDLVYDKAGQTTGVDIRPLKQTESSLIKLGDIADKTKNTLSAKGAVHATEPLGAKIAQTAKGVWNMKARPVSSFFSYEAPGIADPLSDFNRHMKSAFPDIKPTQVMKNGQLVNPVQLPKYNLNLKSPAGSASMTPLQQILRLSGGESIPGTDLKLTSPPGETPGPTQPSLFEDTRGQFGERAQPIQVPESDVALTPSGDMPPALQRVLGLENPGVPSSLYPGVNRVRVRAGVKK